MIKEVLKKNHEGVPPPPPPPFAANNQFSPHILDVGMGEGRGWEGLFYVFTLLHGSEHSEHFCFCFVFWFDSRTFILLWSDKCTIRHK